MIIEGRSKANLLEPEKLTVTGLPTFVIGIATWFVLADDPEQASYLSQTEKKLAIRRAQMIDGQTRSGQIMYKADVIRGLTDYKTYVFCAGQFCLDTMLYGYSTFLPTIIKGLGHWTTAEVQALTIPCYACGALSVRMSEQCFRKPTLTKCSTSL